MVIVSSTSLSFTPARPHPPLTVTVTPGQIAPDNFDERFNAATTPFGDLQKRKD
jgi:hypothetical protein